MKKKIVAMILAVVFMIGLAVPVMATEAGSSNPSQTSGISLEQAVERALTNSLTLQSAELSIERAKEVRDKVATGVDYTPTDNHSGEAAAAFEKLVSSDISYLMAKKTKSAAEDVLTYSVLSAYTNVLNALENYDYAQKSYNNSQLNLQVARLYYQLGISSTFDKDSAESLFKSAAVSLENAKLDLKSAYESLNKLMGLNADERPILSEKPAYSQLAIDNIDTEISRAVENNPDLWQKEQAVQQAKIKLNLLDLSTSSEPWEAVKLDVKKAQLTQADAKENVQQTVRSLYTSISLMEQNYISQQEVLKTAEDTLRVTKIKYDVGMATKVDIEAAELSVTAKRQAINKTIYSHELAKLKFRKPWIS